MRINTVLIKPRITEKALALAQKDVYCFEIDSSATKPKVKSAVEALFGVKVDTVKIVVRKGKTKRTGRKMKPTKTKDKKIAIVSLKSGKITIFPQP